MKALAPDAKLFNQSKIGFAVFCGDVLKVSLTLANQLQ